MARFISDDQVLEVQQATDIVELISEYLPLKKAGVNYKALCPFHDEKTPSFVVSSNKQIYHCFGCHKGGNIFSFLMAFEKVEFPEAVQMLAERSGIRLKLGGDDGQYSRDKRAELLKTNRQAADFYHRQLIGVKEGEPGRAYLQKRGFNQGVIGRFLLGYAAPGWDNLLSYARQNKIKEDYLSELGLIVRSQRQNKWYDRFRGRLMFPIFNTRDRVVGFGGRTIAEESTSEQSETTPASHAAQGPVYLNSPESELFNKGKSLYGLNFAKDSASKKGELWIVEGYTDVIMAHQHGFEWVVATLGTALTADHIKTIRRFVNKVVVVYDADTAGEMASARTLDMFLAEEVELYIARLPKGLDPYDCLVQKGPEVFKQCAERSQDLFDYRIDLVKTEYDLNTLFGKTKAADELLKSISRIPNVLKKNLQVKKIAEELRIKESVLQARLSELARLAPPERRQVLSGGSANNISAAAPDRFTAVSLKDVKAGEKIIGIMLEHNTLVPGVQNALLPQDFPTPESEQTAAHIFKIYERYGEVSLKTLLSFIAADSQLTDWVVRLTESGGIKNIDDARKYLNDCLRYLEQKRSRFIIDTSLKQKLKEAQQKGDKKEIDELLRQFQDLQKSLITSPPTADHARAR